MQVASLVAVFFLMTASASSTGEPKEDLDKLKEEVKKGLQSSNPFDRIRMSYRVGDPTWPEHQVLVSLLKEIRQGLEDPEETVRSNCANAIAYSGTAGMLAIFPLMEVLKDPYPAVRGNAAFALGYVGRGVEGVPEALRKLLQDQNDTVRRMAVNSLGLLVPASQKCQADVLTLLKDPERRVREATLDTLLSMKVEIPKESLPALRELLLDKDLDTRIAAIKVLHLVRSETAAVRVLLVNQVRDSNDRTATAAANSLLLFGPSVVADLIELLADPNADTRYRASWTLGMIGAPAKEAVPALRKALISDKDERVRARAAAALGGIGKEAQIALPDLRTATKDGSLAVRQRAEEALCLLAPAKEPAQPPPGR